MRWETCLFGLAILGLPTAASAQQALRDTDWTVRPDAASRFKHSASLTDARFGAPLALSGSPAGMDAFDRQQQDAWFSGEGFNDRLRITSRTDLRRDDGTPLLPWTLRDGGETSDYDVTYSRGWVAASGKTASGLEVSLTPHAGLGFGSDGTSAEAGATLRIGQGLDRLAPNGEDAFGDRPRWYLYAASSKRAVGYNFARTRDGDFTRSGMSNDRGTFLGDASVGVAYRRGSLHSSFGVVYREIEAKGVRGYQGINTDVSEGLVAFQLTIRP